MEKKTIGSFIATLRKANGMTQRELAEKLNVTDKTVSRWETDEGLPDVTMIPVLAEIFNVSCDEILRGERINAEKSQETVSEEFSRKGEKQLELILRKSLMNFRSLSLISMGLAVLGVIASMIANLGFLRAYIGFYSGMVFTLVAAVLEAIAIFRANAGIDEDIMKDSAVLQFRTKVTSISFWTYLVIIVLFSSTLVLLMAGDPYMGVELDSVISFGLLYSSIALLLSLIVGFIGRKHLFESGRYYIPENRKEAFIYNGNLLSKTFVILVSAIVLTLVLQLATTDVYGPFSIAKSIEFNDYDSFREFMARKDRISEKYERKYMRTYYGNGFSSAAAPEPADISILEGETIYYDQYGNEISFETAHTSTLRDRNDNIVCTYLNFNDNVASIRFTPGNGTVLPIKVVTFDALYDARNLASMLNMVYIAVYVIEVIAASVIYTRKRRR